MDPATGKAIPGIFVGGWSRNASSGVVGIARRDGIQSAHAVLQYLSDGAKGKQVTPEFVQEQLLTMGYAPVKKEMLTVLESAERIQAQRLGVPEFKFVSNDEMLQAIGESEVA
jgi:ferredoxin--NADP+ reductase